MKIRAAVWLTAAALIVCYAPVMRGVALQWWRDEDMGHGFLVPLVIAWFIWRERARWMALTPRPAASGIVLLLLGAALYVAAAVGAGLFTGAVALIVSMAGAVVCIGGYRYLRVWAFPLLLTAFMVPKLAIVYNASTLPLQLLASRLAAGMLTATGVAVIRQGNILDVGGHQIAVAEACSGIRYLLPLVFSTLVFARVAGAKWRMTALLLVLAIPVAVLANAARVAISGYAPRFAEGTWHEALGWALFVVCLGAVAAAHSMLRRTVRI